MAMRERFTDDEWALVRHVPFDAFVLAALADKKVEPEEVAAFTKTLEMAPTLSDPLHREIAMDWVASGVDAIGEEVGWELRESGSDMLERNRRTKSMLKDKLTTDEYQSFVLSVTLSGMAVAAASTGKKKIFHKRKAISEEEAGALAAFAAVFDVDLAGLQRRLQTMTK